MNAVFNSVEFIHRLEAEGIARGAAEAIAQGIEDRNRELATKRDLEPLALDIGLLATRTELAAMKTELQLEIKATAARQTIQFGAMLAAGLSLATAITGIAIALH